LKSNAEKTNYVLGPNGHVLTLPDLPQPGSIRWVARRKAELVVAVSGGLLTLDDACNRYGISLTEFLDWELKYARRGLKGLRTLSQRSMTPH
jgi:hypothetical protein